MKEARPVSEITGPVGSTRFGKVEPLALSDVRLGEGLLGAWSRRNRDATIGHGIAKLESEGSLDNFRRLVGQSDAPFRGPIFMDSDTYKTLEAVAWELGHGEDEALRAFYDHTVALLERTQAPDGYLNSAYQRADRDKEPWTEFTHGHELYCVGHLIQAAIAGKRALNDDRLLRVAQRAADLVTERFGSPSSAIYPGHPEIEYALIELHRLTGEPAYLSTAQAFLNRRGHGLFADGPFGPAYYQDDQPVRDSTIMRGHAVRALYLNAGVTDLYLQTGEPELLAAVQAQWRDLVARRSYLTGGTGSRHRDEAFGDAYELPSERSYSESCAGIAAMHWAWRMHLATARASHLDFFETVLYNVFAASTSADGRAFFYSNPLQRRPDHGITQEEASGNRLPWFYCACCPPNIMRTFATIEGYLATKTDRELQLLQYTRAHLATALGGDPVELDIDTDYPARGTVRVSVERGAPAGADLALRIPGWCHRFTVTIDGTPAEATARDGMLRLPGALRTGATIELTLAVTPEFVAAHPRVDGARGAVALRRGPVVYCAQQSDNQTDVDSLALFTGEVSEDFDNATALGPSLVAPALADPRDPDDIPLYSPLSATRTVPREPRRATLRPYATWGDTDSDGAMRVWLPSATTE